MARTSATGTIEVHTYEPTPYLKGTDGGPDLVEIKVTERFHGDIDGLGIVRFLQTSFADGAASFVGVEQVSGSVGGRRGTFVLQDSGTLRDSVVTGTWFVVPGSGTGDLTGLRGEGGFTANLGQNAEITLDYWFE
jgi:Protein of unknown function (DUF3224)